MKARKAVGQQNEHERSAHMGRGRGRESTLAEAEAEAEAVGAENAAGLWRGACESYVSDAQCLSVALSARIIIDFVLLLYPLTPTSHLFCSFYLPCWTPVTKRCCDVITSSASLEAAILYFPTRGHSRCNRPLTTFLLYTPNFPPPSLSSFLLFLLFLRLSHLAFPPAPSPSSRPSLLSFVPSSPLADGATLLSIPFSSIVASVCSASIAAVLRR